MDRPKRKCFWINYPITDVEENLGRKEERIPLVPGADLGYYLRERKLVALFRKCRTIRSEDRIPVRLSYEPRSGDVIEFLKVRREE